MSQKIFISYNNKLTTDAKGSLKFKNFATSKATSSEIPSKISMGIFFINSGEFSATSSISIPPAGEAINTGPF